MPKIVNHQERKLQILAVAIKLLRETNNLDSVNIVQIAERVKLTRPTIYQYFKDKDDIYLFAVKELTSYMFVKYSDYARTLTPVDALREICKSVIDDAKTYQTELLALVHRMLAARISGKSLSEYVFHRTRKLSILLKRLIQYGIRKGEIDESCNVDEFANELLYLLRSACFHMIYFHKTDTIVQEQIIDKFIKSQLI